MKNASTLLTSSRSLTIKQHEKTDDDILIPSEVAQLLRVSTKTLYRWTKRGEIPHRKIGGQYRYFKSELDRWLKGDNL